MSVENNKAIVRRLFEHLQHLDMDRWFEFVDEHISDEYVFHDPSYAGIEPGREGFKRWFRQVISSFRDWDLTIEDILGDGDKVVTHFRLRSTDTSGKTSTIMAINIMRLVDGKIKDEWEGTKVLEEGAGGG